MGEGWDGGPKFYAGGMLNLISQGYITPSLIYPLIFSEVLLTLEFCLYRIFDWILPTYKKTATQANRFFIILLLRTSYSLPMIK
jgi:hypothetical protein